MARRRRETCPLGLPLTSPDVAVRRRQHRLLDLVAAQRDRLALRLQAAGAAQAAPDQVPDAAGTEIRPVDAARRRRARRDEHQQPALVEQVALSAQEAEGAPSQVRGRDGHLTRAADAGVRVKLRRRATHCRA